MVGFEVLFSSEVDHPFPLCVPECVLRNSELEMC